MERINETSKISSLSIGCSKRSVGAAEAEGEAEMVQGKKSIPLLYIMSLLFCLYSSVTVYGVETEGSTIENPIGFTYKVIHPENQRSQVGYFDLRMKPKQKQTIEVELRNLTDKDQTIEVSLNGTTTNSNGVIENGPTGIEQDASLRYAFEEIVSGPETIKVPAKGTEKLSLTIQMPAKSYDGVISGGIQLKETVDEKKRSKQTGVINEYAFLIGVLLTETDTEVYPKLVLNTVVAGTKNGEGVLFVNLSNIEAAYLGDLVLEVTITQAGKAAVLYETKRSDLQMGPNNQMSFPVPVGSKLVAGDYEAHVLAVSGEHEWSWDQPFTITDEEAKNANEGLTNRGKQGFDWQLVVLIFVVILLTSFGIFYIVRRVNKEKVNQNKKSERKEKLQRMKQKKSGKISKK
ncbi:DUF916 and DUF3324 domain-containing protein [Enterococcus sp. BWB1-3]|uniref:DUF916 and DUF3324 domain-containing protein n=1 Tax=unclassified Enterococcus TaxID=2608891 RepID=UPI0019219EC1|nr:MULTISPECIES: DUF916 and DUF3324 domain-containing protein [unclassified Enterococcus]MBL1229128.1 DUF916 and DUF3324 domain-containing protein [Enterococcus sp. BWB1-3]MCB5952508.1 DUF916 and DUF3324 domain-containing protein [Enterococcus sp. BWT-B8]MCB5953451.1 DUF916 and DUF3324 domain-containing protein [Enterococcus sp. CWB-B31]